MVSEVKTTGKKIIVGFIMAMFILFLMGVAFGGTYAYLLLRQKTIAKNVYVDNIDLGGLTKEAALMKLREQYDGVLKKSLTLQWDGGEKSVSYSDLGVSYNYGKVVDMAYAVGKDKNIVKALKEIYDASKYGVRLQLRMDIDTKKSMMSSPLLLRK